MKKRKTRWWLWLILGLLLVFGLVSAAVYLMGVRGISAVYDDPEAILSDYDKALNASATLQEDGTLLLRLEKRDIFALCRDYDLTAPFRAWVDWDARLSEAGFRISEGKIYLNLRVRSWGFLPLSYQAELVPTLRDGTLTLRADWVELGNRLRLPEKRWPALLSRELTVDLTGTDFAGELLDLRAEGSTLVLRLSGLQRPAEGTLSLDRERAAQVRMFGTGSELPEVIAALAQAYPEGRVPASVLLDTALSKPNPGETVADIMSFCEKDSLPLLWRGQSAIACASLWDPLKELAEERAALLGEKLAQRQKPYESLLFSVREMYRSGSLGICDTGFYNPATGESVHPGTLSRLPVTAGDSRIVFLSSQTGEVDPESMPDMLKVPYRRWLHMDELLDWKLDVDLGVMLTTEAEVPVVLYCRRDGTLVVREVTDAVYVAVMVTRCAAQLDADTLPPVHRQPCPSGDGFTKAELGFLE